jgi:phytoene dehydrogenase-like protein
VRCIIYGFESFASTLCPLRASAASGCRRRCASWPPGVGTSIIGGGGHNGLACAAYLARAGKQVLVLEARERLGGACAIEETWPGYRVSPCAYLCGLLHPAVIDDLRMVDYGLHWTPATSGMFVPFDDGSSSQLWEDDDRCAEEIRRFAPRDVKRNRRQRAQRGAGSAGACAVRQGEGETRTNSQV